MTSYENIHDIDSMDDDEIRELIVQELDELPEIDSEALEIEVEDGNVTLSGRVGTEQELQQIEQVITDVLGIDQYTSGLMVDELVRAEYSPDIIEAESEDEEVDAQLEEEELEEDDSTPSSDHLTEDLAGDAYGTQDVTDAIEKGQSYTPPDRPFQMGTRSEENH